MSKYLLSIDPGKRACGCAMWREGKLMRAAFVRARRAKAEPLGDAVDVMALAVTDWAQIRRDIASVVIELPQTYGGRAKEGDANTLIELAVIVGSIQGRLDVPTTLIWPHDWKGSIPKENDAGENVIKNRALEKLSPEEKMRIELPAKSFEHNVYDAIGIGLWALKR